MQRVLKMSFKFDSGRKKAWTLPDPKSGIKKDEVETAMNAAITEKYFQYINGDPTEIDDYYIYETNTVPVD